MPPRFSLLTDANRQVQIADHLLTVTYPMVKDPKLLLSVIEHCRRAIEDCAEAVVQHYQQSGKYELPESIKMDAVAAFADLVKIRSPHIAHEHEAIRLAVEFRQTLQSHKEAHSAFKREDKLIIANQEFEQLKEINAQDLKKSLITIKAFVHSANAHVGGVHGKTQ